MPSVCMRSPTQTAVRTSDPTARGCFALYVYVVSFGDVSVLGCPNAVPARS